MTVNIEIPDELCPESATLVKDIANAIGEKLLRNQVKYGWSNEWVVNDWEEQCRREML